MLDRIGIFAYEGAEITYTPPLSCIEGGVLRRIEKIT